MKPRQLFKSYLMGGFECADHLNRSGNRVNLLQDTQHDIRAAEDYQLISELGIKTVREGICWSEVEKVPYQYDFSEVLNRMRTAKEYNLQVIWDLIHFGYPDGLFPTHPHFSQRFASLCEAFAAFYKQNSEEHLMVVPVNEISFLSWFSGEARGTVPYAVHNGWDIKYHLCKAAIKGIEVLKRELPSCTIVMVEPLVKIHCNGDDPECLARRNEYQFEAMDIIGGRLCPELGGQEDYLEILGFNYYWNCQWKGEDESLCWPDPEGKRVPLRQLLAEAYQRYQKPIFLSETGHFGEGRASWLKEISEECSEVVRSGIDFKGICLYPVTDRTDWDNFEHYHNSGIFDLDDKGNRIPVTDYINAIREHQEGSIAISVY